MTSLSPKRSRAERSPQSEIDEEGFQKVISKKNRKDTQHESILLSLPRLAAKNRSPSSNITPDKMGSRSQSSSPQDLHVNLGARRNKPSKDVLNMTGAFSNNKKATTRSSVSKDQVDKKTTDQLGQNQDDNGRIQENINGHKVPSAEQPAKKFSFPKSLIIEDPLAERPLKPQKAWKA